MIHAVIPAAGKGTRSGLDVPKTLQTVDGMPILVRILRALQPVAPRITVIVSPTGRAPIADTLGEYGLDAELVEQAEPRGMGHAVAQFAKSRHFEEADEIVVVWGDMLALSTRLVEATLDRFRADGSDFAFPTHYRTLCYTHTERDATGRVVALLERREFGAALPDRGEADCGLFVFRKAPVFRVLSEHADALRGPVTGETGFLAAVRVLAALGCRVDAYPIARDIDAASFNSPEDLRVYSQMADDERTMPRAAEASTPWRGKSC